MIYREEKALEIIEGFANEFKTDIKSVSIDMNSTEAEYKDGRDITVYGVDGDIKQITFTNYDTFNRSSTDIKFNRSAIKRLPFYIVSNETLKTSDDLCYENLSDVYFFLPYYRSSMTIRPDYDISKSKLMAHFELTSEKKKNNYVAAYYEELKTSNLNAFTNSLSCRVGVTGTNCIDELVSYIKELKEKYRDRECEIGDIIKAVILQTKINEHLRDNFLELTELTGVREKIKRLQK